MRRLFGIAALLVVIAAFIFPVAAQACGGGDPMYYEMPTRLSVGMHAMMTYTADGDPLRIHQTAGLDGQYLGQLYNGTKVDVIAGPIDTDGLLWWQVRTTDNSISKVSMTGWAAEGSDGEYWISPAA